jgi:hypothetical protein
MFLAKLSNDLDISWIRQVGTGVDDRGHDVTVAPGAVYLGGMTDGTLSGASSVGGRDAAGVRYDLLGNLVGW